MLTSVGITVRRIDHEAKLLAVGLSGLYNTIGLTCTLKRWTSASTTIKFMHLLCRRTIEGLAKVASWVINLCQEAESLNGLRRTEAGIHLRRIP